MTPDWSPPTGEHDKLGRLDSLSCGADLAAHGRARVWSDWLPTPPGSRFPSPPALPLADDDDAAMDDDMLAGFCELAGSDWQLVADLREPRLPFHGCTAGGPVAISPDGQWLATGETGLHDLAVGQARQHPGRYPLPPVFTPDSRCMLVRDPSQRAYVQLHDLASGPLDGARYRVRANATILAAACSLHPRPLVALATHERVQLHDMFSGRIVREWARPADDRSWMLFRTASGRRPQLIVGGLDQLERLDIDTGGDEHNLDMAGCFNGGVLTSDGAHLVCGARGRVNVIDVDSGEVVFHFGTRGLFSRRDGFSPDDEVAVCAGGRGGTLVVTNSAGRDGNRRFTLWSINIAEQSAQVWWHQDGDGTAAAMPCASGDRFLLVSYDDSANCQVTVRQGHHEVLTREPRGDYHPAEDAAFTPDSRHVLMSNGELRSADTGEVVHRFAGCTGDHAIISRDGAFGIIAGFEGIHRVQLQPPWQVMSRELDDRYEGSCEGRPAITPDGSRLLWGHVLLRTSNLRTAGTFGMVFSGGGHAVISPDGRLAAITNGTITPREILVVDLAKRRLLWRKGTATDDIRLAGFTADSQFLAVASDNGRVRWYAADSGSVLRTERAPLDEVFADSHVAIALATSQYQLRAARLSPDRRKLMLIELVCALFHRSPA